MDASEYEIPRKMPPGIVYCKSCTRPLIFVFSEKVRDTCDECGGKSLMAAPSKKKKLKKK